MGVAISKAICDNLTPRKSVLTEFANPSKITHYSGVSGGKATGGESA